MASIHEIIRLVGLTHPDTHLELASAFPFYAEEDYKNDDFYRKVFGIEKKIVHQNGTTTVSTYYNGKLHSYKDEPAQVVTYIDDEDEIVFEKSWYKHGVLHRENGPAVVESDGVEEWLYNGKHHRIGGPAIITPGCEEWMQNGVHHRTDGPAFISTDFVDWYIDGKPCEDPDDIEWGKVLYSH